MSHDRECECLSSLPHTGKSCPERLNRGLVLSDEDGPWLSEVAHLILFQSAKQPTSFTSFNRSCGPSHLPSSRSDLNSKSDSRSLILYYAENENICSLMLVHRSSSFPFCVGIVQQSHAFP